jgi:hypothetical protein
MKHEIDDKYKKSIILHSSIYWEISEKGLIMRLNIKHYKTGIFTYRETMHDSAKDLLTIV